MDQTISSNTGQCLVYQPLNQLLCVGPRTPLAFICNILCTAWFGVFPISGCTSLNRVVISFWGVIKFLWRVSSDLALWIGPSRQGQLSICTVKYAFNYNQAFLYVFIGYLPLALSWRENEDRIFTCRFATLFLFVHSCGACRKSLVVCLLQLCIVMNLYIRGFIVKL